MKFLAISGSLRAASLHSALLRTVAALVPDGIEVEIFGEVGALPLFNPDLESDPPAPVRRLRDAVGMADALIIASPEYAHGVTGAIKNLLDWLVSVESFVGMPVAVLNASPRAHHADDALKETLRTMSARIVMPASVVVPLLGAGLAEHEIAAQPELREAIVGALLALREAADIDDAGDRDDGREIAAPPRSDQAGASSR